MSELSRNVPAAAPPIPKRLATVMVVVSTLVTFALSRVLWPEPADMAGPPSHLLPFFIVLGTVESVGFGFGVAFLLFGYKTLGQAGAGSALTRAAHISITWLLLSWWPHDNFHRVLHHEDWAGLLRIEYGFHLTLVAAAAVAAAFFVHILWSRA